VHLPALSLATSFVQENRQGGFMKQLIKGSEMRRVLRRCKHDESWLPGRDL